MAKTKARSKILVLCLPGIGDTLMFTPALSLLKEYSPNSKIDALVMFKGSAEVLKNNPAIDEIFQFDFMKKSKLAGLKFARSLARTHYDLSILAFPAYRKEYHFIHYLCGAKKRLAHTFGRGKIAELNFLNTDLVPVDSSLHNAENNIRLLAPLGILPNAKKHYNYFFPLAKEDKKFGDDYYQKLMARGKQTLVGIHPGSMTSALGEMKRWSPRSWAKLIDTLRKKRIKVVVFCGPDDVKDVEAIKKYAKEKFEVAAGISIGQTSAIISKLDYLVANDSGLGHIAGAFPVKVISLIGPTNPTWSAPYHPGYVTVVRKAKFEPWYTYFFKTKIPQKYQNKSGMEKIKVEDVLDALKV